MVRSEFLAWEEGAAVSECVDSFFRAHQQQQVSWGSWNDSARRKVYSLSADVKIGPRCDWGGLTYGTHDYRPKLPCQKQKHLAEPASIHS